MVEFENKKVTPSTPDLCLDFATKVYRLFQAAEDPLSLATAIGVHGTSLEAVAEIVRTGKLPTGKGGTLSQSREDNKAIYFFPTEASVQSDFSHFQNKGEYLIPSDGAIPNARMYAGKSAALHEFMSKANLSLDNPDHIKIAFEITYPDERFDLEKTTALFSEVERINGGDPQGARLRKIHSDIKTIETGVIIYFDRKTLETFTVESNENPGLYITCPNGFPINCILAIEPLGDREFRYLASLDPDKSLRI